MKSLTLIACLMAACLTRTADAATSPWTYSTRTLVCSLTELQISFGTTKGGIFVVSNGRDVLLNAWAARGILKPINSHCKRLRPRTLPKPIVPRPSYPMGVGEDSECSSRGPVLIHARFLRSGERVTGLYVSVRERRTGRFIAAGLFSARGPARAHIGPTCVGR